MMATKRKSKAAHLTEARSAKGRDHSPKWDNVDTMSEDEFSRHFRISMDWYRLESSGKDLKPKVITWMAANDFTKDQIALFKKTKDWRCNLTVGALVANMLKGMPDNRPGFNEGRSTSKYIKDSIAKILEEGKNDVEEEEDTTKPVIPAATIQDRLRETAGKMSEEIDYALDEFSTNPDAFDPKAIKVLNLLKAKEAKAAHARIIKTLYSRDLAELEELASGNADEQLREGYSHRTKKQIKNLIAFYQEIMSACDMLAQEAKVNRAPRAKKSVPAEKIVAKLKFMKTNEPLKLVSVNPTDIIGAGELWVYNTKNRKLGKYVAKEFADLGVKGTTITGFDELKSVQKTLRKPADQLKEFKAAGKVALRKFLEDINAVDTKMNGRINEEILLLKVA
jgi:hypothetical protein